jgi:hypothetical protein
MGHRVADAGAIRRLLQEDIGDVDVAGGVALGTSTVSRKTDAPSPFAGID